MPVPNPHVEEYEVKTNPIELSSPTRLWFQVAPKNTSGDKPVHEFFLRKYTSGSTRVGKEAPEDETARVQLVNKGSRTDYDDAKAQIGIRSTVSYLSTKLNGFEHISNFTWS
jgi:hypothetical protein